MNINNDLIKFEKVVNSDNLHMVTVYASLSGATYKFDIVENEIHKISLPELQHKYGDQFTKMCRVAKVVDLQRNESLEISADTLSLQGRKGEMQTHALSEQLKITLPKNIPSKQLKKIGKIYQVTKVKTATQAQIQKNIICKYSQGQIGKIRKKLHIKDLNEDDNLTSQACTYISLEAIKSYFKKGPPKNEEEIYKLIHEGALRYREVDTPGQAYFREVFEEAKTGMKPLDLPPPKMYGKAKFDDAKEFTYPNTEMKTVFDFVQSKANSSSKGLCAVLTTESLNSNATIVIMFDQNKKPVIFNSHGETIDGKHEGASLRRFNDMDALTKHIKHSFYKDKESNFQLMLLENNARSSFRI